MGKRSRLKIADPPLEVSLLCLRVADRLSGPGLPCRTERCAECRAAVWVAASSFATIAADHPGVPVRILCMPCGERVATRAAQRGEPVQRAPISEIQRAEIQRVFPDWKG